MEVQKLEAQAQAQAVAAMQVSAAAQRAEAEAQKHLVVHAQVAAQAQELQAKAVHLQVRLRGRMLCCYVTMQICPRSKLMTLHQLGREILSSGAGRTSHHACRRVFVLAFALLETSIRSDTK
jgi:hypothetical protein